MLPLTVNEFVRFKLEKETSFVVFNDWLYAVPPPLPPPTEAPLPVNNIALWVPVVCSNPK